MDINKRIMHSKDTLNVHINLSKSKLSIDQSNSESEGEQPVATLESSVVEGYPDDQSSAV